MTEFHAAVAKFKALGMPTSGAIILAWEGIHTLEEVTKYSEKELLHLPRFGRTSLRALRKALASQGLALRGETPAELVEAARKKVRDAEIRLANARASLAALVGEEKPISGFSYAVSPIGGAVIAYPVR